MPSKRRKRDVSNTGSTAEKITDAVDGAETSTKTPGNPFEEFFISDSSSESFLASTQEDSTGEFSVIIDRPKRIVRLVGPGQESSSLKLALAISDVSFTAANEGYLATMKTWKKIQLLMQEDDEHAEIWDVVRTTLDHLLITATLWSPLLYISNQKGNEDSFTNNIVRPFLTSAFGCIPDVKLRGNGDRFTCGNGLDKELKFPDFSVTMDCYNKTLGEHYLVIAEVKPPNASRDSLDDDYIKLANLMKSALHWQLSQGYDDGMVVGFLIQGWRVMVFHLALEHEALYELRSVGQFQLVANYTQLAQILSICPVLLKTKYPISN
ncbi:hypothetical protein BGZ49_008685 [Haplosporangium sp. Z 27]|nr:hypothetical protein BGZ49_008685 [Haplosporangium sp. Z 27]